MSTLASGMKETRLALPAGLDYAAWADMAGALTKVERNIMWWLGDWILYGERHFDEAAYQAVVDDMYSKSTIKVARWVCECISPDDRNTKLSFSHHKVLATLDPKARKYYMDLAVDEGISVHNLQTLINRRTIGEKEPLQVLVEGDYEAEEERLLTNDEVEIAQASDSITPDQMLTLSSNRVGKMWTHDLHELLEVLLSER